MLIRYCQPKMAKKDFYCINCKRLVKSNAFGTYNRNHCNFCLFSRHVDIKIGDRKSTCGGVMEPVDMTFKKNGELMLIHKCIVCNKLSNNRIAGDDNVDKIMDISERSQTLSKENKIEVGRQIFGN